MPDLTPLNSIDADTPAAAEEVDQNFDLISAFVNSQLINRDGSVAMEAPLDLIAGDPSQDNHAANKGYVDALLPIGVILPYGGQTAPAGGWRLCAGQSVTKASFEDLFDVIGYRYGGSGGSFNLPDLRQRIPIGMHTGVERFEVTGRDGGTWEVPMPEHHHSINHNHPDVTVTSGGQSATHTHEHPHNHTINHNHPNEAMTTSTVGDHNHAVRTRTGPIPGAGPMKFVVEASDINFNSTGTLATSATGDHQHSLNVDLDVTTGMVSGAVSEATTGNASVGHTHNVVVPITAIVADSGLKKNTVTLMPIQPGVATAVTSDTQFTPPYVTVNYIIRVSGS